MGGEEKKGKELGREGDREGERERGREGEKEIGREGGEVGKRSNGIFTPFLFIPGKTTKTCVSTARESARTKGGKRRGWVVCLDGIDGRAREF